MPQKPLAFGPSSQYVGGEVTKETQCRGRSRSLFDLVSLSDLVSPCDLVSGRYCGLMRWIVDWYNLTVTGVVSVGGVSSWAVSLVISVTMTIYQPIRCSCASTDIHRGSYAKAGLINFI